jgi:hypothetical protein
MEDAQPVWVIRSDFLHNALEVCRSKRTRKRLKTLLKQLDKKGPNGELYADGNPVVVSLTGSN